MVRVSEAGFGREMKELKSLSVIVLIVLSVLMANAQVGTGETKHFEKDGLAFNYPAGWRLTDNSSPGEQSLTLASEDRTSQIVINKIDRLVPPCDFQAENEKIANALAAKVAKQIKAPSPLTTSRVKTQVGAFEFEGVQLHGVLNHKPVTGDIYSARLNRQFVSLVYLRNDQDEEARSVWDTVRTTLTVSPGNLTLMGAAPGESTGSITGGVLNGRALKLGRPEYPAVARMAHASGTVVVQVLIDEEGNVVAAHAISGHPLLQATCVKAARESKFSPTKLCGEPVRVNGVIQYNFVAP